MTDERPIKLRADKLRDLIDALECDEDEVAFEEQVRKVETAL